MLPHGYAHAVFLNLFECLTESGLRNWQETTCGVVDSWPTRQLESAFQPATPET